MFHIACSVSVKFNQATGYVTEGETYEGIITLEERAYHNLSFNVTVLTRSESAFGEYQPFMHKPIILQCC